MPRDRAELSSMMTERCAAVAPGARFELARRVATFVCWLRAFAPTHSTARDVPSPIGRQPLRRPTHSAFVTQPPWPAGRETSVFKVGRRGETTSFSAILRCQASRPAGVAPPRAHLRRGGFVQMADMHRSCACPRPLSPPPHVSRLGRRCFSRTQLRRAAVRTERSWLYSLLEPAEGEVPMRHVRRSEFVPVILPRASPLSCLCVQPRLSVHSMGCPVSAHRIDTS